MTPAEIDAQRERAEKVVGTWLRDRDPEGLTSRVARALAEAVAQAERDTLDMARWAIGPEKYVSDCEHVLFALSGDPVAIKNGWLERAIGNAASYPHPRTAEIVQRIRARAEEVR